MFNKQQIEEAIINLQNGDFNSIEQANNIIMEWSQKYTSIREAIDIITTTEDERMIFQLCPIAQKNILQHWVKYSKSDRSAIRQKLENLLVDFSGSNITRLKIIDLVVSIALKDWPEDWPSCVHDFIHSASNSQEMCILDMQILSELIVTIHDTPTITNSRRRKLIDEFDQSSEEIMQMIDWSLANVDFESICDSSIKLLKELCLTAPYSALEPFMENLLPALFNSFATNELCSDDTVATLSNLLIERSDARDIAAQLFPETLSIIGDICSGGDILPHILIFIMNYLSVYGPDIDELCFEGEEMIEDTSELVRNIYTVIANNPPINDHVEEFWKLWSSVLSRYSRSTNSNNPFEVLKPCFQLFQPLLPLIRDSLFQGFPSAEEGGKLQSLNCQACWIFITSADKNGMIEFLKEQQPSPSLCYAIGLVDACLSGREERDMIVKVFPALFEFNQKVKDIDFGVSLLYAIARAIRFMNKEFSFLKAFGICLLNFIQSEDARIRSAAVNALFYIAMRQPKLLLLEEKTIWDEENEEGEENQSEPKPPRTKITDDDENEGSILFGVYDSIYAISDWEIFNSTKFLKSIALVAASRTDEASKARIYERVSDAITSFITSGIEETIDKGLKIIESLTSLKLNNGSLIFTPLYPELVNILSSSTDANDEISVSEIVETITSTLLVDPNATVMSNIEDFTNNVLLQLVNFREPALFAFSRLRMKYDVLDSLFDQIYEALIKDIINELAQDEFEDEAKSVLRFMRSFNIRRGLISLLLEIIVYFVNKEKIDVSEEALEVLIKIIEFLCEDQEDHQQENQSENDQEEEKIDLTTIVEQRMFLIDATFTTLTDTFHKSIFNQIARAIQALYRAMSVASMIISPEQFDQDIKTVLSTILPNFHSPNENFLINFSKALRGHANDFALFSADLKEFLVTTNCASPSDKYLFRNELKLDSLEQELMNLVAGEEKSAIVAEELEILPALKNFNI